MVERIVYETARNFDGSPVTPEQRAAMNAGLEASFQQTKAAVLKDRRIKADRIIRKACGGRV